MAPFPAVLTISAAMKAEIIRKIEIKRYSMIRRFMGSSIFRIFKNIKVLQNCQWMKAGKICLTACNSYAKITSCCPFME